MVFFWRSNEHLKRNENYNQWRVNYPMSCYSTKHRQIENTFKSLLHVLQKQICTAYLFLWPYIFFFPVLFSQMCAIASKSICIKLFNVLKVLVLIRYQQIECEIVSHSNECHFCYINYINVLPVTALSILLPWAFFQIYCNLFRTFFLLIFQYIKMINMCSMCWLLNADVCYGCLEKAFCANCKYWQMNL